MDYIQAVLSYYHCSDDAEKWVELWDSGCDSRCPKCNAPITPYLSITSAEIETKFMATAKNLE
jgi:hypothetical protein